MYEVRTHCAGHERLEETALEHGVHQFLLVRSDRHRTEILRNDDGLTIANPYSFGLIHVHRCFSTDNWRASYTVF